MPERSVLDEHEAAVLCRALKLEEFYNYFTRADADLLFPGGGLFAYAKGETVTREGEPGKDLFVLCSGRLVVEQVSGGAPRQINQIDAGSIFGEIGLLKDGVRSASTLAVEDSLIFRVTRSDLRQILEHHPDLGEHLKALASRRKVP